MTDKHADGSRHCNWSKDYVTAPLECLSCGYRWTGLRPLATAEFDLRCPQIKCHGQSAAPLREEAS